MLLSIVTVTTAIDEDDGFLGGNTGVSLREAIRYSSAGDTVQFDAALDGTAILLTIAGTHEDAGADGDLDITHDLTLLGNGVGQTIISAGSDLASGGSNWGLGERVLHVLGGTELILEGLTIAGGNASGPGQNANGGGLYVAAGGRATISNATFSGNTANLGAGGGIASFGTLAVTESTLTGNRATTYGGGVLNATFATATFTNSTISVNSANTGGGLMNTGASNTFITESTITKNSASSGGGVHNSAYSTISITDSSITENSASQGGGVYNAGTSTVSMTNSPLVRNSATADGGAVYTIGTTSITNSTLSENSAANGGGIFTVQGTTTITDSTLARNSAGYAGGALWNYVGSTIVISNSTLTKNTADYGGGMWNQDAQSVTLKNSTLSGNSADFNGGGIYNSTSTVTLLNSTLNLNSARDHGGGLFNYGTATLTNTIVAGSPSGRDVYFLAGSLSGTNNLIQDGSRLGNFTNSLSGDPLLGPLQDNGGPTLTHALLNGSPAINAGSNAAASALDTDQRGFARIGGTTVDIGAFEFINIPATVQLYPATTTIPENSSTATRIKVADIVVSDLNVADVVYDFVADFSTTNNPNGAWAFRGVGNTDFTTYNSTTQRWQNVGAPATQGVGPGIVQPAGYQPANVNFTSPTNALYTYSVTLDETIASGGDGIDFAVTAGDHIIAAGHIADGSGVRTFTGTVFLQSGEAFYVGVGDHGGPTGDQTGLAIRLTTKPHTNPLNVLSLSGPDAALFEIVGTELFLKEGVSLDFETKSILEVVVEVDDATIPGAPDGSKTFTLQVTDVNEAPVVTVQPRVLNLLESTILAGDLKVADVIVLDDALGSYTLGLTGSDAVHFRLIGNALYLKQGTSLDFETKPSYSLLVTADDPTLSGNPDAWDSFQLRLIDVYEPPGADLLVDGTTVAVGGTVNFGEAEVGGAQLSRVFVVRNTGNGDLLLQPITVPAGFRLIGPNFTPGQAVAPGDEVRFEVMMETAVEGTQFGELRFSTNDRKKQIYKINLAGAVVIPASNTNIIDDGDAGFYAIGAWNTIANFGYKADAKSAKSADGSRLALWAFGDLTPGLYRISATWLHGSDRSTSVSVTIRDDIGGPVIAKLILNQRLAPVGQTLGGRKFQNLDSVSLQGRTLVVEFSNAETGKLIIADAVRIENVTPPADTPDITIRQAGQAVALGGSFTMGAVKFGEALERTFVVRNDGTAPLLLSPIVLTGSAYSLVSPNFTPGQSVAPGAEVNFTIAVDTNSIGTFLGSVSLASNDVDESPFDFQLTATVRDSSVTTITIDNGDPDFSLQGVWTGETRYGYAGDAAVVGRKVQDAMATWTFTDLTAGTFNIATTWLSGSDRASNATYILRDGVGGSILATVVVNQKVLPVGFTQLGRPFQQLRQVTLTGSTLIVELRNAGADGVVVADAVRIERVTSL